MSERAKELLICAIECDKVGRILEAQNLYEEGIEEIKRKMETLNGSQVEIYQQRLQEYVQRSTIIKYRINGHMQRGEIIARFIIPEDSTNHNYDKLFGQYMTNATREILLQDTFIREHYQFQNLVRFLELAVIKCPNLKFISLITKDDPQQTVKQKCNMNEIITDLKQRHITLSVKYDDSIHDRKIVLSNGYIITLGRGLDFYKPPTSKYSLGMIDYRFRKYMIDHINDQINDLISIDRTYLNPFVTLSLYPIISNSYFAEYISICCYRCQFHLDKLIVHVRAE